MFVGNSIHKHRSEKHKFCLDSSHTIVLCRISSTLKENRDWLISDFAFQQKHFDSLICIYYSVFLRPRGLQYCGIFHHFFYSPNAKKNSHFRYTKATGKNKSDGCKNSFSYVAIILFLFLGSRRCLLWGTYCLFVLLLNPELTILQI